MDQTKQKMQRGRSRQIRRKMLLVPAVLAVCLGIPGMSAWGSARGSARPLYRQTVGIGYMDGTENFRAISTYDEQGRLIEYEKQSGEMSQKNTYAYEEDDRSNPVRIIEEGEGRREVVIENHYTGDALTEAVVTDILVDGQSYRNELESFTGPDDGDGDYMAFERFEMALYCLKNYQGYQDIVLYSGPDELRIEHTEGGDSVSMKIVYPDEIDYLRTDYLDDGGRSEETRITTYYEGELQQDETTTIIHDGAGYFTGYGQAGVEDEGSWSGKALYSYGEERTNEETGEKYRSGTISSTEGDSGPVNWPYGLYAYTDENGEVIRSELVFDFEKQVICYQDGRESAKERYRNDVLLSRQEITYYQ